MTKEKTLKYFCGLTYQGGFVGSAPQCKKHKAPNVHLGQFDFSEAEIGTIIDIPTIPKIENGAVLKTFSDVDRHIELDIVADYSDLTFCIKAYYCLGDYPDLSLSLAYSWNDEWDNKLDLHSVPEQEAYYRFKEEITTFVSYVTTQVKLNMILPR